MADDALLQEAGRRNLEQIKAMGAISGHAVRTGPNEALVVVVYPDEATYERVREEVMKLRSQAQSDHDVSLIAETGGEVLASV